jgi:hypothetical protein
VGGQHAGRQADDHGEQHREERELERRRKQRQELVEHGLVGRQRRAEIALQHVADVIGVLHRQ